MKTVPVTVNGDATVEPSETFLVSLDTATNAVIADAQGQGTILDDDAPPSLSIDDVRVSEGNSGSVSAVFTVSLSRPLAVGSPSFTRPPTAPPPRAATTWPRTAS